MILSLVKGHVINSPLAPHYVPHCHVDGLISVPFPSIFSSPSVTHTHSLVYRVMLSRTFMPVICVVPPALARKSKGEIHFEKYRDEPEEVLVLREQSRSFVWSVVPDRVRFPNVYEYVMAS